MTENEKKKKFFKDRLNEEPKKKSDEKEAEIEETEEGKEPLEEIEDEAEKEADEIEKMTEKEAKAALRKAFSESDELKSNLEKLKSENEEAKNDYLRARADCENVRRRKGEEIRAAYDDGRKSAIEKILPIGDSLDWALKMPLDDGTRDGIEKLLKKYHETLSALGVQEFSPEVGSKFDPSTANAVMTVAKESDSDEIDTVKQVYGRGYKLGEKVMRYAQVSVIKE